MDELRNMRCAALLLAGLYLAVPTTADASGPGQIAADMVTEASYRHFLDDMLYTHATDNRSYGPEHDLARDNIVAILESYGLTVELEPFFYWDGIYYNVVATKLGTLYPDQEYIVGAHYDAVCYTDCNNAAPGADDNASGVALVLEAARIISQFDSDYTIRFIAFDKEELNPIPGLAGAYAYVDDHITDDILGMISADMIAYDIGTYTVDVTGQPHSEPLRNAIGEAVLSYGIDINLELGRSGCGSDHCPFEQVGIPACEVIEDWGNPYWHHDEDNVDMPDYLDYTMATKITRSIVGFLVDAAGVQIPLPSGDYTGDGNVDSADFDELMRCYTGEDTPPDDPACLFFDFLADGDIDCVDADIFEDTWTAGGEPPSPWQCNLEPAIAAGEGCRCVEITPPPLDRPSALLVTGDPENAAVSCVSRYVQANGTLGESPVFQMWDEWGTILVCDAAIIPGTAYSVWCDFGEPGEPTLSTAVEIATGLWADTAGIFEDGQWTPPNNDLGIMDVVAILDAFKVLPGSPPIHYVDLVGIGEQGTACSPDQSIDMVDALAAIDAFRGIPFYETANCPVPCP